MTSKSSYFTVKRISILAIFTAFVTVGRLIFSLPFLPNIQPLTTLLIIITLNIGIVDGLVVSILSLVLTNLFLGMGLWTVLQIISFMIIILVTGLIKYFYRYGSMRNRILFATWSGIAGFLYGFVISLMSYRLFGFRSFWIYYLNGVPYDILHMIGNIIFFIILEPIIVPIILKKIDKI